MSDYIYSDELKRTPIDIPRAALSFAKEIAYPELDIPLYIQMLDQLVEWARNATDSARTPSARVDALGEFLFQNFGLQGNAADYQDPRNSYLNEVLDRRLGIPISLSVVYLAVAKGLGLDAQGVGLPGHFIVRVESPYGLIYLDPFHSGARLSVSDCARLVRASTGYEGDFQMEWLEPSAPGEILARMLNNLKNIYVKHGDWPKALAVLERLHITQPDQAQHLLDMGLIHHEHGLLRKAVDYYERYLAMAPDDPGAQEVRQNLEAAALRLAQLN
jgi:regulator of sirC expression with transglutaminase-like and TPR domain